MTKAEDKIRNIKEAMAVFEQWLEENGGSQSNKNSKTDSEDKVETVPGLGFKDKEAAEKTLKWVRYHMCGNLAKSNCHIYVKSNFVFILPERSKDAILTIKNWPFAA